MADNGLSASPPRKIAKMSADNSPVQSPTQLKNVAADASSPMVAPPKTKRLGLMTGLAQSGSKKLTLKPKPRTSTPTDPAAYLSQSLTTLTRATRAILTSTAVPESLQALYTLCENAVSGGPSTSQTLYDRVRLEIERQTGDVRRRLLASTDDDATGYEAWLKMFEGETKRFLDQVLLIRSVLLHLDRTYVLKSSSLLSIWDLGIDLYRHSVVENEEVSGKITSGVLHLIQRERDGDLVPRPLVHSVIVYLSTMSTQTHADLFVTPFLATTREYYEAEAAKRAQEFEPADYLKHVNRRLHEEGERCDLVVGAALKGGVLRAVLESMVNGHVEAIVEKALGTMIKAQDEEDLSHLYQLLSRVSKLDVLRAGFLDYIKVTGYEIVMDKEQDDKMVTRLISLRQSSISIVDKCFGRDADFRQSISSAFEFFINKRENKPAEMMAKFLDQKLRSGNRGMDDAALEAMLDDVLFLFRFTQGKDMFEAFYKRDLAKRLLLNKSASFDAERSMLTKLKDECGPGFTSKLEIMFKDIELSEDIMRAYNGSLNSSVNPSTSAFDLSVNILSQGNWPSYAPAPLALPSSMSLALDRFKSFYQSKYNGRTLSWAHSLDTCSLKAKFPKGGRKELSVSLFQAVVLLLFNDTAATGEGGEEGTLAFKDIVEMTRLDPKEAKRTLQSLACGKVRVLQKHPKGRDVNDDDTFSFNKDFKDDHIRIKINQIQQTATAEENQSTSDRVFTDRSSHLQLAIVRIMKARKTLKYNELVMEIVTQIGHRFKVEPSEIKKSISSLIDREYLKRSETSLNTFEYLA